MSATAGSYSKDYNCCI